MANFVLEDDSQHLVLRVTYFLYKQRAEICSVKPTTRLNKNYQIHVFNISHCITVRFRLDRVLVSSNNFLS